MNRLTALCTVLLALLVANPSSPNLAAQGSSPYQYAYVAQQPGQAPDLILADPDGSPVATVTIPTNIVVERALLSPSGEWLALLPESSPSGETITLYHIVIQEMRLLTVDMGLLRGYPEGIWGRAPAARWSSDGHYLAYISQQNGQQDVFVYSPGTGDIVNLTNNSARHGSLAWGANHYLAFSTATCAIHGCNVSVEVFDFPNQTPVASVAVPKRHSIEDGGFCDLQLSPDNAHASFVRHCGIDPYQTPKEVYVADFISSVVIPLTSFTETGILITNMPPGDPGWHFADYGTVWSDNQTVLVGSAVTNQQPFVTEERTYRYNINDVTNPTVLLEGLMARQWAANPVSGQMAFLSTVGYYEVTSAQTQLATWDNSQLTVVGNYPPGCNLLWSPDYRFLAYSRHDVPFSGCEAPVTGFYFLDTADDTLVEQDSTGDGFVFPAGWIPVDLLGNEQ